MIKVLVIDDHIALTEGTKSILESSNDILVDTLSPPFSIESIISQDYSKYDVVLMDINLGLSITGIEVSKMILKREPDCKIIVYTGYDIADYFEEAINNGLYGAINKNITKQKIIAYINEVLEGNLILSIEILKRAFKRKNNPINQSEITYTERERKILNHLGEGLTNQEISDKLYVSKRTVEYSLTDIFQKLGVSSRSEAVLIAKSEGLIN
jgi:two-component system, NarL family, competent response regulator ComA